MIDRTISYNRETKDFDCYVDGRYVGSRPNYRTVQDNVSEWLKAYNTYAPQMTPAQVAQAFYWDPTVPNADGLAPVTTFTLANGTAVNLGLIDRKSVV
mgnify:CR=1 FL=1